MSCDDVTIIKEFYIQHDSLEREEYAANPLTVFDEARQAATGILSSTSRLREENLILMVRRRAAAAYHRRHRQCSSISRNIVKSMIVMSKLNDTLSFA